MNKDQLMYALKISYFNLLLSCGASTLFANKKVYDILKISKLKTSMYEFTMDEVVDLLKDEKTRTILIQNFMGVATRTFMKESFEHVKKYCETNGYSKELTQQPWYHYARIVRNCLSHDFLLHFSSHDKKLLPVIYRDAKFTLDMDNKNIPSEICNHNYALLLYEDMVNFIESLG